MFKKFVFISSLVFIFGANSCSAVYNNDWDYVLKVKKQEEKIKYKKKLLPESGYQTVEQYEQKSQAKDKAIGDGTFIPAPKDSDMKYIPQPKYKIVRYNNPPGTAEINLTGKVHYDRQETIPGIISSDFKIMVFPIVSYYAKTNSTDCDVYILPLNRALPDVEKILKANIAKKFPKPIFSTDRTVILDGTFRTITPIDFSTNNMKIIAKEKTGNAFDGIWKTDLLIYDFTTKETHKLSAIREAIRLYWLETEALDLKEVRWDIYPMGFDAANSDRIIVNAYAYTGERPRFLGVWSIDTKGTQSRLVSLDKKGVPVSTVGFKLAPDGIIDAKSVLCDEKRAKSVEKNMKKNMKKELKSIKKEKQQKFKSTIKDMEKEYKNSKKEYRNEQKKIAPKIEGGLYSKIKYQGGTPTSMENQSL